MPSWLSECSETRNYRFGQREQAWTFRLHRGPRGHASLSCPINRGDELIYPAQGAWADEHLAGLGGVRRIHEGYFEVQAPALVRIEREVFKGARLEYRGFMTHALEQLAPILAQRTMLAVGEAYSVGRTPQGLSFGLSLSRSEAGWVVYGVWAVDREPKDYAAARADFFEAYPELADIEAVARAVGPQRRVRLAAAQAERVLAAFTGTPSDDFSYATASWTFGG